MRILIIGLGSIGLKHVKAIKSLVPGAKIFALRSKLNAEEHLGVNNIYHLNEIDMITIDFAIVSNPTSEHKKTIEQLIVYKSPLFIEKPIYSSLDNEYLIKSINYNKIITYVACNLRFLDCLKFIKDKITHGNNTTLNEVNVYCGSYLPDWRSNIDFRNSYSANKELGGGVHLDLIHELDYLYWIFGFPKAVRKNLKSQSSLSISAFDYANYLLDYKGFCANVILNYYRRDPKRNIELVFENETWNIDLLKNEITCDSRIIFSSEQRIADTYQTQMEYFMKCVKEKTKTFNTFTDAYNVLKICLDQ